jgi:hypothetical protein
MTISVDFVSVSSVVVEFLFLTSELSSSIFDDFLDSFKSSDPTMVKQINGKIQKKLQKVLKNLLSKQKKQNPKIPRILIPQNQTNKKKYQHKEESKV